jgi:excisionase family DNA binding protein
MPQLISTGAAAELLGTSRQHVVNLVKRGVLRNHGTNVHRRVERGEVVALIGTDATRDDRQSLWLHVAVAGRIVRSPERTLARARTNLARMERAHGGGVPWLRRWRHVLEEGPEQVIRTLVADTAEGRELRQNSPFAGVLTELERRQALESFRAVDRTAG